MARVTVDAVTKVYQTRTGVLKALEDVTIDVASGEFLTLLGPSGCGKSTLLRAIGGLLDIDDGVIRVGGDSPEEAQVHKRFAWVPQSAALVPWRTVLQNVTLPRSVNKRANRPVAVAPEEILESVGLAAFASSRPSELSGGMQQRVSLARGFAQGAEVLLMDEPFAALDEITRVEMRFLLLSIWEQRRPTVVFVTHSLSEAVALSDRVIVFTGRPGRVAADIRIDLPRPRGEDIEDTPAFASAVRQLRTALHLGAAAA